MSRPGYHHGDLREGLVRAARAAVEAGGPEAVSLRELAQSLGVSTAAPYRHFRDRRALLAAVAAEGFSELVAAYKRARAQGGVPMVVMRNTARVYLALAFAQPGMFRLMFDSDILSGEPPPSLTDPAMEAWVEFCRTVSIVDPTADERTVKRRAVTGWSTLHGYVTLAQAGRLAGFMTEPLTEADLLEAILDKALTEA
ncbi:TetR-like C-terminal domain-containing protein [Phenylobacterium sp.]|uniref:TetR-like C-terminal domain-containing protein n=1 Tax=Phenylobacterium sp. TaxID=1871053 RepID=UPI002DEBDCAF|nr:TetR-like C-terminal domain-containing protein [Phenylobacterium sp.]